MIATMLEELGYRVLPATTPQEALDAATTNAQQIRLLMTDVIMPEMNGRELANMLRQTCPRMDVLFTSGYTADIIAKHGVLDDGGAFLEKPLTMAVLAEKIRQILGTP